MSLVSPATKIPQAVLKTTVDPTLDLAAEPISDTLLRLRVDLDQGLSQTEVETRRKVEGTNEISEKKVHPIILLLSKFWGLSPWMLELIMFLSLIMHNYPDLAVVGVLLVVNAVVSFTQEKRAAGVVEALRKRLQVSARVRREGIWQVLPARDLVPGDIIRLRTGDITPADVKLLTGNMSLDQSALTGESMDSNKVPGNVLSSGSLVRQGEGNGVVILTGAKTYFGHTTELVQLAKPKLHLEEVISKVVRWLFIIVGTILFGVVLLSIWRGSALIPLLPLLLVLLMSAVPVALPVMFTVSMAYGSRDLARHGVLVTRLSAVEDAATMDLLCVDKTGTITQNSLTVTAVVPMEGLNEGEVLYAGALASKESNQDPIDLAFIAAAKDKKLFDGKPHAALGSFVPFDAQNRRTEAIFEQDGQRWRVMKGAVETITQLCTLKPEMAEGVEKQVAAAALKGYRTLAVAKGPVGGSPALLGLVMLFDPPRSDAKQLIGQLKDLGVSVMMLTGDALAVAGEIGRVVGLSNIHPMAELKALVSNLGKRERDLLAEVDGFAEVFPEDKYRVVKYLQDAGHVTGMTGDGVNDAPALRQAEVGIAVSSATDIAKGAASVVLTEPGLTNIVALITQGRTIYQRILTWIINKISRTLLKASYVAIAYLVTGEFVISAFVMLLLVFVTDFAVITLATDKVRPSAKPETWNIGGFVLVSVSLGLAMLTEALIALWFTWDRFKLASNPNIQNTFSFLILLYFAAFSIVSVRERRWFWSTMPSKVFLSTLVGETLAGTILTFVGLPGLAPLTIGQNLLIFNYAMVMCLGVNEMIKVLLIQLWVPNLTTKKSSALTNLKAATG